MNPTDVQKRLKKFLPEMEKITRARLPLELEHFVVGRHESRFKQYYQIVIETEEKHRALQNAEASVQLVEIDIEELEHKIETNKSNQKTGSFEDRRDAIHLQKKKNELSHLKILMIGALKEIDDLLKLAENHFSDFAALSEDELVRDGEKDYWHLRAVRQCQIDILTFGRIQAGNLGMLLQMPKEEMKAILCETITRTDEVKELFDQVNQIAEKKELRRLK